MDSSIDEKVLEATTKCHQNFACLKDTGCLGCEVDNAISSDHILVNPRKAYLVCQYATSYGYGYICSCPTRCELYRKTRM